MTNKRYGKTYDIIQQLAVENERLKKINDEHKELNGELNVNITRLESNWNKLKSLLEKQINSYEDTKNEIIKNMVTEDKQILFVMKMIEEGIL